MSDLIKTSTDISKLKNEITMMLNEAFAGLNATSDGQRRDILNRLVEQLKTLQSRLEQI